MRLGVFLSFNGQAEEAFRFYADLFQTEIKGDCSSQRYDGSSESSGREAK